MRILGAALLVTAGIAWYQGYNTAAVVIAIIGLGALGAGN